MLDHRQVVSYHMAIHEPMYSSWVPWNIRPVCTPGTNKTNPFHSYHGLQVPVQTWTLSPHSWDPVSVWCLDLHLSPPPISRFGKSRNHDKNVTRHPAPISKYVLRIISLWPDYHLQQRMVLNRHEQGKQCNQAKPHWPRDTTCYTHQYPYHIPVLSPFFLSSFYYESNNNHLLWVTIGYSRYQKPKHSSYSNLH